MQPHCILNLLPDIIGEKSVRAIEKYRNKNNFERYRKSLKIIPLICNEDMSYDNPKNY